MFNDIRKLFLLFLIITLGGCQTSTSVVKSAQPQSQPKPVATQKVAPAPQVEPAEAVVVTEPQAEAAPQVEAKSEVEAKPAVVTSTQGELYVLPTPADARIRVMNIVPQFVQGMRLPAGRYSIEVSAPGYQTYLQWITLEAGKMKRLKVNLTPQ